MNGVNRPATKGEKILLTRSQILIDNRQCNELLTDNRHVDTPPPPPPIQTILSDAECAIKYYGDEKGSKLKKKLLISVCILSLSYFGLKLQHMRRVMACIKLTIFAKVPFVWIYLTDFLMSVSMFQNRCV